MKRRISLFLMVVFLLSIAINYPVVRRQVRQLHLFDSVHLIKTSSFDHYTVDAFQVDGQLQVEIYSDYSWFEDKTYVKSFPIKLKKSDISVIWKQVDLEKDTVAIDVMMLYVEVQQEGTVYPIYDGYLANDKDHLFDIEDFFHLQEIDIKENPSKID
ncbi:TPA: hypothetical protein U0K44_001511 [Streptococcus suis]|nr:hypothetical protein [Streptococcus suis]